MSPNVRIFSSFLKASGGNVAISFGVALLPLALGVGVATDYGRLSSARTALQRTADAAALAGARALASSQGQPESQRIAVAAAIGQQVAASQAPRAQSSLTPVLSRSEVTAVLSSDISLMFGGLIGRKISAVAATSTASYLSAAGPCLAALGASESTGIEMTGSPRIAAPKCSVVSNSTSGSSIHLQGAAKIAAAQICAAGKTSGTDGKTNPAVTAGCAPSPDPYTNVVPAAAGGCDYTNARYDSSSGSVSLRPGVYCGGLVLSGASATLSPGIYEIRDGPLSITGSGSVSGTGVSIVLRGTDATLQLQGSVTLALTAPSSGPLSGIAIAAAPGQPAQTSTLQGAPKLTLTGSLYLPTQRLSLQGSASVTTLGASDRIAALSFDLQGSPDISILSDEGALGSSQAVVRIVR